MAAKTDFCLVVVVLVFTQLKACLNGKPCLNHGTCKTASNASYCECHEGFNGTHCENKITKRVFCLEYRQEGYSIHGNTTLYNVCPENLTFCGNNSKCFYFSYAFKYPKFLVVYTLTLGNCYPTCVRDYCDKLIQNMTASNHSAIVTTCRYYCCGQDFCNVKLSGNKNSTNPTQFPGGDKNTSSPPKDDEDKTRIYILIGSMSGVVIALVILIIIVAIRKKKKKNRRQRRTAPEENVKQ